MTIQPAARGAVTDSVRQPGLRACVRSSNVQHPSDIRATIDVPGMTLVFSVRWRDVSQLRRLSFRDAPSVPACLAVKEMNVGISAREPKPMTSGRMTYRAGDAGRHEDRRDYRVRPRRLFSVVRHVVPDDRSVVLAAVGFRRQGDLAWKSALVFSGAVGANPSRPLNLRIAARKGMAVASDFMRPNRFRQCDSAATVSALNCQRGGCIAHLHSN